MVVSNATDARDKPTACKVPKGYFMKSPGQIAPCDQGSYQDKYLGADQAAAGACTACEEGVTTADKGSEAASDCNKLKPGYVATDITTGITTAVLCPQGYYCPGSQNGDDPVTAVGITTLTKVLVDGGTYTAPLNIDPAVVISAKISKCPKDAWTKTVGATAVDQCMVPPGFIINVNTISACTDNTYRSDWLALAAAAGKTCASCGTDILAEPIEPITLYSLNTTAEAGANTDYAVLNTLVRASSKSCYIVKGQGMYYVANGTSMIYKARNCGKGTIYLPNSYGVAGDKVYGLAQTPCKLCPAGMKTDDALTNATVPSYETYKAANGFFTPLACVTLPGYGYDGRVATQCAKGWYNAGNNYLACTQCGYGLTTETAGKTTSDDCLSAPGFGYYNGTWATGNGKMQQCPAGTYNNETRTPVGCTACPGNSWTEEEGSDAAADCTICKPGFGGPNTGACVACGGNDAAGSYGPPGRDDTELACVACPTSVVGFQFWFNNTRYNYTSPARAAPEAKDAADCVSAMAQIEDGLWYLAGAGVDATSAKTTISECADYCLNLGTGDCMFATLDYAESDTSKMCKIKRSAETGDIITAFKAVPSSDVSQSRKLQAAKPKAVSTGMYTQWLDTGAGIGEQNPASPVVTTKAACFDACDAVDSCAGVVWNDDVAQNNTSGKEKCLLITGATAPDGANVAKRSLTRAKPSLFAI